MNNLNITLPANINGAVITEDVADKIRDYQKQDNYELERLKNEFADIVNDLYLIGESINPEFKQKYTSQLHQYNITHRIMELRWEVSNFSKPTNPIN